MKINNNKLLKLNPKNNLLSKRIGIDIIKREYTKHLLEKIRRLKSFK